MKLIQSGKVVKRGQHDLGTVYGVASDGAAAA